MQAHISHIHNHDELLNLAWHHANEDKICYPEDVNLNQLIGCDTFVNNSAHVKNQNRPHLLVSTMCINDSFLNQSSYLFVLP